MAQERLTDRTELASSPADSDLVHIVDVSDTTDNANGTSKKITIANLLANVQQTTGNKFIGDITLVSGYTYSAYQQGSVINGVTYDTYVADSSITLSAADGSNDRFDVIVFESDSTFDVVEGTAAADPIIPTIDTDTQVIVRIIRVTAASSTESGVTNELVYDEDTGVTTEWNATTTANVNEASTEQASSGTKSIKFTSATTSDYVSLVDTSTHDGNLATQIKFKVYLPTSANYRFYVQVGNIIQVVQDGLYGFSSSTTGSWQQIIIPASEFAGLSALSAYDTFVITNGRNNTTYFIDEIYIVEGFNTGSSEHPNYTLNLSGTDLQLLKDGDVNSVADFSSFGADATISIKSDITANTTISGTQKGLNNIYPVNNSADRTITVDKGTYAVGDVVNFMRKGEGAVTIDRGTNVRLQGARNIDNVFKIKDVGGYAAIIFEYLDGSTLVASVIGDIERGYTGPVTTSSYSGLQSSETADVTVAGTGFSDNMLVTLSGNATLNSYTVNSNTSLTLNITSSGTDGDFLTVTYDNGQVFEDTNAIQLTDIAPVSVVIETTSTSATWSPTNVNNSGSTLTWTVTGDASGTYNANDPTIDLSGNVGTAIITITSADDLAGWTTARFTSLNITSADVTNWTACTELWFVTNGGAFTTLTGAENLVNATKFDLRSSGFTSFSVPTGSTLTELQLDFCINLTTITNLANATGLQILDLNNTAITSLDVTSNTALTTLNTSTTSLTAITGLSSLTSLTNLNIASCDFSTIDIDANNALTSVSIQGNSLSVSSINNVIIDLDAAGLSSGTLNYSAQSPTANPTATEVSTDDVLDAYNALVGKSWTITGATPA